MTTPANPGRRAALCSMATSIGLLIIAVALIVPLASGGFDRHIYYKYVYTAGAAITLLAALFNPNTATDLRERRWHRFEAWSAIFFCAGAAFQFIDGTSPRDWLAFTLAGAVIRIICFVHSLLRSRKKA